MFIPFLLQVRNRGMVLRRIVASEMVGRRWYYNFLVMN